jgi:hypothetical protein
MCGTESILNQKRGVTYTQLEKVIALKVTGEIVRTINQFHSTIGAFIKFDITEDHLRQYNFIEKDQPFDKSIIDNKVTRDGCIFFNNMNFYGDLNTLKTGTIVQFDVKESRISQKFIGRNVSVIAQPKVDQKTENKIKSIKIENGKQDLLGIGDGDNILMDFSNSRRNSSKLMNVTSMRI